MRWRKLICAGLALAAGLTPSALRAQVPMAPPPVVPVAPAPVVGAPAPVAAAPNNLWSFLCPTREQRAECREKLCSCGLFKLLNAGLAPAAAFTGGIIGPVCPPFPPGDLMKP